MTPAWAGKGPRNVATLTEETLKELGVLVPHDPLSSHVPALRPCRLERGVRIAVGGFPGEQRAVRILQDREGVVTDPALGEFEWEVQPA